MKKLVIPMFAIIAFAACDKENTMAPANGEQTQSVAANTPSKARLSGAEEYEILYTPPTGEWYCASCGGNCLPTTTVGSASIGAILQGDVRDINTFFAGSEWQSSFPAKLSTDRRFISLMTSQSLVVVKEKSPNGNFYLLSDEQEVNRDNAAYIISTTE